MRYSRGNRVINHGEHRARLSNHQDIPAAGKWDWNLLEPKENLFKILDFTADDFDPFRLEHFDFFLDRDSRRLPFKPPNPTG
jgi:hypothetical protein